jgi:hypothetical protein
MTHFDKSQTHYRFKFYMGKAEDPEDRSHVELFYLGHLLDTTKVIMFCRHTRPAPFSAGGIG